MKLKKERWGTGTQLADTAALADGSPAIEKEGTMSADKADTQGDSAKKRDGQRQLLIGISAAILAVLVIASVFTLGYFIGRETGVTDTLAKGGRRSQVGSAGLKGGLTQAPGGGTAAGRVREMIRNGEAELARGDVTSVEGGKVILQTESGSATIALTDNTRFVGQGSQGKAPGAAGGEEKLANGQKVTVLVKRDSGGNLEALMVRVMGQGAGL